MKNILICFIALLLFGATGCAKPENKSANADVKKYLERSRASSLELVSMLKKALVTAIKKGGPEEAVSACGKVNGEIMNTMNEDYGFFIRRVSTKNRNPKNVPDEYEEKIINTMEKDLTDNKLKEEYYEISSDKKFFRWMKPLLIKKICLRCHGELENMRAEVVKKLNKNYPNDKAVSYKLGQLRGAITVKINLDPPSS